MPYFGRPVCEKNAPLYVRAIQAHPGATVQPNFSQKILEQAVRESSSISGLRRTETAIKEGWYQAASKEMEDDRQFT